MSSVENRNPAVCT